jgi:hypothetical protein
LQKYGFYHGGESDAALAGLQFGKHFVWEHACAKTSNYQALNNLKAINSPLLQMRLFLNFGAGRSAI